MPIANPRLSRLLAANVERQAHDQQPIQAQVLEGDGRRGPQPYPHASRSQRAQPRISSGQGTPHEPFTAPTG